MAVAAAIKPMAPQRDAEMAVKYGVAVELLRQDSLDPISITSRFGKTETARKMLKEISLPLYQTFFPEVPGSPRVAPQLDKEKLFEATSEYAQLYPAAAQENAAALGRQLFGVLALSDLHEKMRLLNEEPRLLEHVDDTLVQIEERMNAYRSVANEQSLIGAASPDFRKF